MTPERSSASDAHEDERTRDRREKRATERALVDERALADRRLDGLLAFDPKEPLNYNSDFPGCVL